MLSSSIQKTMQATIVIRNQTGGSHWWIMDNTALKTLSNLFLILRISSCIYIKFNHNNLNLQSLQFVLNLGNWFTSVVARLSPNKSFNVDCRIDAVFPQVRCAAS